MLNEASFNASSKENDGGVVGPKEKLQLKSKDILSATGLAGISLGHGHWGFSAYAVR